MQLMYRLFTKNPSQESLDTIINNAKKFIANAPFDLQGTGITRSSAESFSNYWLRIDDTPGVSNKNTIDTVFCEILADIDPSSKNKFCTEAKAIYVNVIEEYAKKLKNMYQL
jgi:hypothetical protein